MQSGSVEDLRQALLESESRFQRTLEALQQGVMVRDRSGRILSCNRQARELLYRGDDPTGRVYDSVGFETLNDQGEVLAPEYWPGDVALREGKEQRGVPLQVRWPDGSSRWLEVTAVPVGSCDSGEPNSVVISFFDVTARREHEQALQRRDDILRCVSDCAALLLGPGDVETALEECFQELGAAALADRLVLIRVHTTESGRLVGVLAHEWRAAGVPSHLKEAELQEFDFELKGWYAAAEAGQALQQQLSSVGPAEKAFMQRYGMMAVCMVPTLSNKRLWGILAVHALHVERQWSEAEMQALTAAAALIRTALERRGIEQVLRENQARLMEAQRLARLGDWEYVFPAEGNPPECGVLTWSAEVYRIVEVDPDEFRPTPMNFFALLHPDDRQSVEDAWQNSLSEHQAGYQIGYRVLVPGGFKWLQMTVENVFDKTGRPLRTRGTVQNVTAQKEAHLELQALNQQLDERVAQRTAEVQDLYDHAPCGYHSLDVNGSILRMNKTQLQWLGRDQQEVIGRRFVAFLDRESAAIFERAFAEFLQSGIIKDLELSLLRRVGSLLPVILNATAIRDAQGRPLVSRSTCFEVNDLKKAQSALAEQEASLRGYVENASDLIQSLDRQGRYLYANPAWCCTLGYSPQEALTLSFRDVVHPDDQESFHAVRERILETGEAGTIDVRFVTRRGESIELEANIHAVFTGERAVATRGIFRDITARRQAEEALRLSRDQLSAANAELARASRLKDEFLASMSHELRTPLTGILGMAEALQEGAYGPLAERQIPATRTIYESGRHLLELINDVLDLSKIEAGQLELSLERTSVADICQSSLHLIKGMAKKNKHTVSFSMEPPLLEMRADSRRLKQVLVNLLSNAVKFTPSGGRLGLDVRLEAEQGRVRFSVWDRGIGIDPRQHPRLFKSFTQLDSSLSRQYSGTGLGLALVRRLVDLHGGSVELQSEPGQGSRFDVLLPWQTASSDLDPGNLPTLVHTDHGSDELVLVADDNDTNRALLTDFLSARGFRVLTARDGQEAIECAANSLPDLILMDIQMPGIDGLEAIRRIRSLPGPVCTVPVLALTALAMPGDRDLCLAAGADGYLAKPVPLNLLVAEIRLLLSTKAQRT